MTPLAREAAASGHHPFAALLVAEDGDTVLLPMCAGTQYWAHIGGLVYGLEEAALLAITGKHPENPTLSLACREVFARGQKPLRVLGPVAEAAEAIAQVHRGFWGTRGQPAV